jgi:hypothetical protein
VASSKIKTLNVAGPATHLRSFGDFLRRGLDLRRPELAEVRKAVKANDDEAAWAALIDHFRGRSDWADPMVDAWGTMGEQAARRYAEVDLAEWRRGGRIDWEHGKKPARKDWERYWSHNRLAVLGRWIAAANTLDRADLRQRAAETFLDWFERCPPPELPIRHFWDRATHGFAWRELEVGVRCRLLVAVFLGTLGWTDAPGEFRRAVLLSIRQSVDYILGYTATHGLIPGNHQTHHALPLLAVGLLLPELRGARKIERLGLRFLREHLLCDHDRDGVLNENSPSYHLAVSSFYLHAADLLRANDREPPAWMTRAIAKMGLFALYATAPDGRLIPVNDCRPKASLGSRRGLARAAGQPGLLAPEGECEPADVPPPSRAFEDAAFAFLRTGWGRDDVVVVLDASNHASGHWHPGKPNLIVHAGNAALACDPGLASYDDPSFWNYFRTGRGHNTVLVDGEGDGIADRPWEYVHISTLRLTHFSTSELADAAAATTDGFRRMAPPVDFERAVVFVKPDLVFVHDVLLSRGEHRYEWLLHLEPQDPVVDRRRQSLATALGGRFELVCEPGPAGREGLSGPKVRSGRFPRKTASARPALSGEISAAGEHHALLVSAPYGVWTRTASGRTTFDFVLHVLKDGARPATVERVPARGNVAAFRARRAAGDEVLVWFDDRADANRALELADRRVRGRAGAVSLA